jgi:hypothetical protein
MKKFGSLFMRESRLRFSLLGFVCLMTLLGCQTARVEQPLTRTLAGDDPAKQVEFFHELASRPVACNDEAFHGLLLFLDSTDANADYAARVAALKARNMLPADFDRPAEEAVLRGNLAVAIAKSLGIGGGLMMHFMPTSGRYAMRELIYLDILPPGSPHQTFSGSEFVGIMGRMEDWQRDRERSVPTPAIQAGVQ